MSEWRVYGCGSASSSRSLQSSYEWVEEHFRLQIDFGYGALYRRCGAFGAIEKALNSITHLFLSHGHPDHIADVSRLVIALKYTPGYTHSLPIHLYGTKPTLQCLKDYLDHVGLEDAMDEIFEPHFLHEHDAVEVSGHTLHAIPA
ncbi:MAG: MBL fold metallo-hydrolase, partial [Candidatus Hinthialibacter sp.]